MSKSTDSITPRWFRHSNTVMVAILLGAILISISGAGTGVFGTVTVAQAQEVSFSKAFSPDTIGPGATSTLVFTIQSFDPVPITDLAFTDNLPEGVSIATPANATSTCGGTLAAPNGGDTITFSDGQIGASGTCIITVDVTSSTPGTYRNVSGSLTSSSGTLGSAIDDLNVVTNRPGFSKSFAPSSVSFGGKSTLTFTVDNTANNVMASVLNFVDNFPTGMVVAAPANASTTCTGGTITAIPGTSVISYSGGSVASGASCTVSVDVVATAVGALGNVSGELTSSGVSSGKASAVLDVTVDAIALIKSFTDDPAPPGGTVTLAFTIHNFSRSFSATSVAFTDNLDDTLSGLAALGLPQNNVCGAGSQLSGSSTLVLSGGTLGPEGSCTFSVTLQVPSGADPGAYLNTTSAITADVDGSRVVGSPAIEILVVQPAPILTKRFVDDPVAAGDAVTLTFAITNTSSISSVTAISFEDVFVVQLPTAVSVPPVGFCGAGSVATFTPLVNPAGSDVIPAKLVVSGANLAAGASCIFDLVLNVAIDAPGGVYVNITSPIVATVGGLAVAGSPAIDDLAIVAAPTLRKSFTDDPTVAGDMVTLEFELSHSEEAPAGATNIAFSDDLAAVLSGLTAVGLPKNDVCGTGSQLAGTTNLSFTGGSLAPGASCVFSVTLQVPVDAPSGNFANQTSSVTAEVSGLTATGTPAVDALTVSGVSFEKTFIDDPTIPGGTVTLRFTISNTHPISNATDMIFTDSLDNVLPGLVATGLPATDICGTGSQINGTSLLAFTGGNLLPGESCTFDVTLQVPAGASSDAYRNATSSFFATIGGAQVELDPATDVLDVSSDWLWLTKSFTDDPVMPDDTVTLEFTITNTHATQNATDIGFTDNLDAVLSGLVATGLPTGDVCGAGSQLSGTDLLTLSGGSLGPGASCTFSVTLLVPAGAAPGTYSNTTGQITGTITGLGATGDPATDDLYVTSLAFSKAFDGSETAGGRVTLSFTIENLSASESAGGITFEDDLDAVIAGLIATGLPASDVCGTGSELTGTSLIALRDGVLDPGASCTFSVTLQVPTTALAGSYVNTTSDLTSESSWASGPAVATLTVEPTMVYLPLMMRNHALSSDLTARSIDLTRRDVESAPYTGTLPLYRRDSSP